MGAVTVSRLDEQAKNVVGLDAVIADSVPTTTIVEKIVLVDLSWTRGDHDALPPRCSLQTQAGDLCRIILTSGTTGRPKGIAVSHALLGARIGRHISAFGPQVVKSLRVFGDLSIETSLGFQFLLFTLWRGGLFMFPGKSFDVTIDAFHEFGVGCCVTSPGGLAGIVNWFERYPTLQSEIDVIVSAGDMLPKPLVDRVRSRICPHLVNVYGSTEASITATAPVHLVESVPGAVGYVNPGSVVEVVDESDVLVPSGNQGLVRVRSAFAVDRYFEDPATSTPVFRDGWFYPGDIGILERDGLLRIAGRNDALLNFGGDKINPETIEAVIASFAGVTECAVLASANELGNKEVAAILVTTDPIDEVKLRSYCAEHLAPQFMPTTFIRADRLPRNPMGKVDRRKLTSLLEPGSRTIA
jgi:acyl-coenzyme A synthetase/AMP-(fatty) acid ligase